MKADRIAPTKGAAFDKAAGFHFTISHGKLTVRVTDLDVTFLQSMEADVGLLDTDMERTLRLPSRLLRPFVQSLPMSGDQRVRFYVDDEREACTVQLGKTKLKATMQLIAGDYPVFPEYPLSGMSEAQPLASLLEQVAWSVEDDSPTAIRGVLIDGKRLLAVSQTRAAIVECEVPVDEPIAVSLTTIAPLVKLGTRIRIRVTKGKLQLALDETTQMTTTIFEDEFPEIIDVLLSFELPGMFKVSKTRWLDALGRLMIFAQTDRIPRMRSRISDGTMLLSLGSVGTGEVQDGIALLTHEGEDDDRDFDPQRLVEALNAFPGSTVVVNYGETKRPFLFIDPTGSYRNWVMPLGASS